MFNFNFSCDNTMYYLYLDESGDPGQYRDGNGKIILRSSRFYTLAGILVNEDVKNQFENEYKKIMTVYFSRFPNLPSNFKLHFNSLRMQKKFPYDSLTEKERLNLENDVLSTILNLDCKVMSITLDLDFHYRQYTNPIWPVALALLYSLQRFEDFKKQSNVEGFVVFEKFTNSMRDKVSKEWKRLQDIPKFPKPEPWPDLNLVHNGDPCKEHILAYADFFGFIPYFRKKAIADWNTFTHKYPNFYERNFISWNAENPN